MANTTFWRRLSINVLVVISLTAAPAAFAAGLTDLLMGKLGVTQPQAEGGAGAIFQYAKSRLTSANFDKVKAAVPDMQTYLSAAPAMETSQPSAGSGGGGTLGSLSGALGGGSGGSLADKAKQALGSQNTLSGGAAGSLSAAQALVPAFQKLGLGSGMVGKFVPIVIDYVNSGAGQSTAGLLSGVLGF